MAVIKKKSLKYSKNKKKGWKNQIDIRDVEAHLEDVRLQKRMGGLVAELKNEELFYCEKDTETQKSPEQNSSVFKLDLRCFSKLKPDSAIEPPLLRGTTRRSSELPKHPAAAARVERRQLLSREKRQQARLRKKRIKHGRDSKTYDIWADDNKDEVEDMDMHFLECTKQRRVKVPAHFYDKPSVAPAVEQPDPGASYNPTFYDHQKLLRTALEVEIQKMRKGKRVERQTTEMFPGSDEAPTEESRLQEMAEGLFENYEDETQVEAVKLDEDRDYSVKRPKKRLKQKRRREKESKLQILQVKAQKLTKQRMNEVFRLKSIKAEIVAKEKLVAENERLKAKKKEEEKMLPRRLNSLKFEPPDEALQLSEDLTGVLRTQKPEGNLLVDRFNSLRKRNIIEPRERQKNIRKYKMKSYVKRSHRDN